MANLLSFDVFDTLLTRAVAHPGDVFLLLGRRLARQHMITCSPEMFARLRAEAESKVFANHGGLDSRVDLVQIYAELGHSLGLDPAQQARLLAKEVQIETELLRPVPPMVERLRTARASGSRIIFTSDMYLPSTTILTWLSDHGIALPHERAYVSNEYASSKDSGRLFKVMLEHEQTEAAAVTHLGNNGHADVRGAHRAGIKAEYFGEGNLNRYEEALHSYCFQTDGLAAACGGASRLARLNIPARTADEQARRDVAAGVAAPLLIGFVLWVLREAQRLGKQRLYFIARDGQILHAIAERLAPRLGLQLDLRYLYGSRQAWTLPGINSLDQSELERLFKTYDYIELDRLSVRDALARAEISPEELAEPLATQGFPVGSWDLNLSHAQRLQLTEVLLSDPQLGALLLQRATTARELTLAYLRQEGLFDGVPFAIIDMGTGGTLHRTLEQVLVWADNLPIDSFYLGSTESTADLRGTLHPYYFDLKRRLGTYEVPGLVTMIETICSADHGTVVRYQRDGERLVPVLKEPDNPAVEAWGYALVRQTIEYYAETVLLDPELVNPWADLRTATTRVQSLFWEKPTKAEAAAWASFPFEDGWGTTSYSLRLGSAFGWTDLPRIIRTGKLRPHRHNWQAGSLALTGTLLRQILLLFILARNLSNHTQRRRHLRQLRQMPRRFIHALQFSE